MKTFVEKIQETDEMTLSQEAEEIFFKLLEFRGNELMEIMSVFREHDIYSLEAEFEGIKVKLVRKPRPAAGLENTKELSDNTSKNDNVIHPVKSKYLGILHLNNEKGVPFVNVGDPFAAGQTLAVVETMNITNDVRASSDGEIMQIPGEDGRPVEYGQILFLIKS